MKIVNKSYSKIDGKGLVEGKPVYTDDLAPKDALIVKVLRSPHAFAKIKNIDVKNAKRIPGVECILTYKDIERIPFTRAGQSYPELSPYDKFILDEYVRHVGDEVAIVGAINEKIAVRAMKLIKVDYEILEPVLDFEKSDGHYSLVHPEDEAYTMVDIGFDKKRNIACQVEFELGNVEKALEESEIIVKKSYSSQAQAQAMMESQRAYTYLDMHERLVVVTSTQIPFHARRILSTSLGIPESKIRVVKPRIGGGFGAKQTVNAEFYPALVTLKTGKPAKIIYTRREVFSGTNSRHEMKFEVTLGASKDGKIKAIDMVALSNTGAYGEHSQTTLGAAGKKVLPIYAQVKNCRFYGKAVYTNKVAGAALRGFGVTQGSFAIESAMNELAIELGMDPIELRDINMIRKGQTTKLLNMTTKGWGDKPMYMDGCMLQECILKGKDLIGWDVKYPRQKISPTKIRGVGMAIAQQGSGIPKVDMAAATLKLNTDGFFNLLMGATDLGTGSDTILAQIAAETLGVDLDKIIVYSSDTDLTPFDAGAYASSTTYTTGNAVIDAAEKMKKLIIEYGAKNFGTTVENIQFDGNIIKNLERGGEITLSDFSKKIIYNDQFIQLSTTGSFVPEKNVSPYMAGFAEVEVDTETGKVDVIHFVGVVDCGTPINPMLSKVQIEGGIATGIGLALYEEVKYDKKGKLMTDTFMQYNLPTRLDIGKVTVDLVDGYEATGPYGAKSIGEVVVNPVAPAITDAIFNAIGVRIRDLPAIPEKVFLELSNIIK